MPHRNPPYPSPAASPSSTPDGHLEEHELRHLIGYQVAQAGIVTLAIFERAFGQRHGMRTVDFTILALISSNGAASPARLAKALGLSPSYISAALDRLQQAGLVKREADEKDRRGLRLHATAEGSALAAQATASLIEAERRAFTALSAVEQLMLSELLHKLASCRRAVMGGRTVLSEKQSNTRDAGKIRNRQRNNSSSR